MPRILVIEDEGPLREEIVDTLMFQGYDVLQAADGIAGLQLAKEARPDLILSDITMPNLDGYDLLLALREEAATAAIPLIFLTARAERSFVRHGMELGADDYLTKPITLPELIAAVEARLRRQAEVTTSITQELEQTKKTLLQMVSHELRTPLISVAMVSDLIERQMGQLSPEQLHELFETLHRGSNRLRHLVEQIIFLTQFEAGALEEAITSHGAPAQLWAILTGSISLAREFSYRNRDGIIRLDEQDHGDPINCYMPALKHALAELIANALSFSPENGEVTISQWEADGYAWISVTDQGCGMSAEQINRAFRDFHQIDRQQHEQQGMGLGLPIARRIIEMHGGTLELQSVVDKGTQVVIRLSVWRE